MPQLDIGRAVKVTVPASSANLGPGFDTLGLSLGLFDEITVEVISSGLEVDVEGEGADTLPRSEKHLIVKAIRTGLSAAGFSAPGLRVHCLNRIPQSRGLGSSATAAVAGIAAADALTDAGLGVDEIVHLSGAIEGHPDNSSASVLGGAVVSWSENVDHSTRYRAVRIPVQDSLRATAFVPNEHASTSEVRRVLPQSISHVDARFNVARSALLTYALQHDPSLLFEATKDRLHQPFRAAVLPVTTKWVQTLRDAGVAAFVSGAGPTALALSVDPVPADIVNSARDEGLTVMELPIVDGVSAEIL